MFGYTLIHRSKIEALEVKIALLEDRISLSDGVFQDLFAEHNQLSDDYAKLKAQHDTLVELTLDPTTPESARAHQFSASVGESTASCPEATAPVPNAAA